MDKDRISPLKAVGVLEPALVEFANGMNRNKLVLPRQNSVPIEVSPLSNLADRGLYNLDINGPGEIGSFDIRPLHQGENPTYPTLWNHRTEQARQFMVQYDGVAKVRVGDEERALKRWRQTVSGLHFYRDFGLSSQTITISMTNNLSIGRRAWPNVILKNTQHEILLLLWCNTTKGLIAHRWEGARQQPGRSIFSVSRILELPVLDTRQLSVGQLTRCEIIFDELKDRKLLPANEAYRDEIRIELDKRKIVAVLGYNREIINGLELLRLQWCSEPSVHGGKPTKPKSIYSFSL